MKISITDFLKLPTKIMVSIALGTGVLLFSPEWLIEKLYMTEFIHKFGFIIGITFVVTLSISIVSLGTTLYNYSSEKRTMKKFKETANARLTALSDYQKMIIYSLFDEDNHTAELPLYDGAVLKLENNLMIGKATSQYGVMDINNPMFPFFLQQWVVDELLRDEHLLANFKNSAYKYLR